MNMPIGILISLLRGKHLTIEECKALGIWPRETLKYDEVAICLSRALENEDWFPRSPHTPEQGTAIREGIYIHRQADGRLICVAQRTQPNDPTKLVQRTEVEFASAQDAANYFMKWELNLPGRLDGWSVV